MLKDLVRHTATEIGCTQVQAKAVLGIILSTAERQGSAFADELFQRLPGARTLSARTCDDVGACPDIISRLIEKTPGGRRHVAMDMIRNLQKEGLGHAEIGRLLPAIAGFCEATYGISTPNLLGEILGFESPVEVTRVAAAA